VLTGEDRSVLKRAEYDLNRSFNGLDKNVVAPLAAAKPSLAIYGYDMLWTLMSAAFYAGSRGTVSGSAETFIGKELHRARQVKRGKRSGESRLANRKWVSHADALALEFRKEDTFAGSSAIASEILGRWKQQKIDPPGHETLTRHVRFMIKNGTLAPAQSRTRT
jgi:hypothetical protein